MLDRMALDDVGASPLRLAAAIHAQLGPGSGPVPVMEIARALDIVEIRRERLANIEGALITTPERDIGAILVNVASGRPRRRFTVAHELLHFLNPRHQQLTPEGFWCTSRDMSERRLDAIDRHHRQEAEANTFAIELLAPPARMRGWLDDAPDLSSVIGMAAGLEISREAAARRYVQCQGEALAVIFSKAGRAVYHDRSSDCPVLMVRRNDPLPDLPGRPDGDGLTEMEEAPAEDWFWQSAGIEVCAQTLYQRDTRAITLLHVVASQEDDDEHEDVLARFRRSRIG